LREKHITFTAEHKGLKKLGNYFPKKFGSLKISITFAAAFRGKELNGNMLNKYLIRK
jgi:hypothetical protein